MTTATATVAPPLQRCPACGHQLLILSSTIPPERGRIVQNRRCPRTRCGYADVLVYGPDGNRIVRKDA